MGFAAFVGDDEDPVSERVRKRAAFFHTIFGTDTDDSDEEFVPRAILSDELSSSSDDGSSDSDDNATGMSSMQIISALTSVFPLLTHTKFSVPKITHVIKFSCIASSVAESENMWDLK